MAYIKNQIDGWLIIDKPYELGSTSVVTRLKHIFHPTKIGHAGTLDPLATGVLPIAFGQATKTIPYVMDGKKTYTFEVSWGLQTETDDIQGKIMDQSDRRPSREEIEKIIPEFIGTILQKPPVYSALKIQGKRAYELARAGTTVELSERPVVIYSLKILEHTPDKTSFEVVCGKGTYVRSLGRDMGQKLGCLGHITQLRRTQCGPFTLEHAISLEKLEKTEYNNNTSFFVPVLTALDDILALAVNGTEARELRQGKALIAVSRFSSVKEGDICKAVYGSQLVALVKCEGGCFKPFRVFLTPEEQIK